ncbi:MAG: DEAD/DEAH box helicase family protein [Chloroflexi bacterium]|nr:DEAD/DEAH box helicase family protein [Chloroflexota bacterium]
MKFVLKDFQADATADVVEAVAEGVARFEHNQKFTAVSLSAPTGAGKTVIATAVIERLIYGDETTEPNPKMTVLWVTDDPSLNQQTKRKMLAASSLIKPGQLITVDPILDQETLDPGTVYFVHIQQLGKGASNYVKTSDKRKRSLWEIIGNTIHRRGGDFLLIVDEAHKGTSAKKDGAKTITARLIDGAGGTLPPVAVVLGISATPNRFVEAINKAGQRTLEPVSVDPDLVRESGLIKDKIRIKHPTEAQLGDSTLLEMAVRDLKTFDELWAKYATEQDQPSVRPVLVIQVKAKVSDAALRETLDTLTSAWNVLDDKATGHAFQEHTTLRLGTRSVRYVAPPDIQDDPNLRVVLFKEALTTGWDCPRAEVMLSFRSARDYTYIAQLIGRMVRTPLARRIATDDVLNTVALYLPYYDEEQVAEVVKGIQSDEGQIASKVEVDSVTCGQNPKVPALVWDLLSALPTYTRPAKNHRNEVARLNDLAVLLAGYGLDPKATETARQHLVDTLKREAKRIGPALTNRIADYEQLNYQTQTITLATGEVEKEAAKVALNSRNIEDLFRRARRLLGDSAAKWYWDYLCDVGEDPDDAKIRVAALAADPTTPPGLEVAAKSLIDSWRTTHNSAINDLPDAKRAKFYVIWQQARDPQQITMIMPSQVTAPDRDTRHLKHVYANGKNLFPATFTGWEAEILKAELAKNSLIAWYRNPTGGTAALGVPWEQSKEIHSLYPDFLFFHEVNGEVVVDIVDPHRPDSGDTAPKWRGLAKYAKKHSSLFRRILAVIADNEGTLRSLDLKNPQVAGRLESAINETDVRAIFADIGGLY